MCALLTIIIASTDEMTDFFFLVNVNAVQLRKTSKPDTTGAVCLVYGGSIELWLQGVRYGDFNLNNAVAVVDGLDRL